ncbi:hypothetical protein V502_02193 [Pseudogymnoascus sp. VKM F-4520 (FW-2644)]|nr:hypothetical protein V502_02193 [Pseudogymnoascus sp. VKM F-4520 (FW-2644)]
MEGYPFGTDSWSPPPTTESTMRPLLETQANSIRLCPPTELDSWTVDSADVFVRSGPNGMNHFAPWGAGRAKEIDPAPASEDESARVETQPLFPHPTVSLPVPELKFDFRMSVTHNPYVRLGTTSAEIKNWLSISGGTWSGPFGSGTVVDGAGGVAEAAASRVPGGGGSEEVPVPAVFEDGDGR